MADSGESKWWIEFFTNAGIVPKLAAKYALIFVQHHMQKNMLLDLNFDILKMMGITAMGDNIAILKHARSVHDEKDLETVMPRPILVKKVNPVKAVHHEEEEEDDDDDDDDEEEEEEEDDDCQMTDEVPKAKKSHTVVTRMFDHYTRNSPASTVTKTKNVTEKPVTKLPKDPVGSRVFDHYSRNSPASTVTKTTNVTEKRKIKLPTDEVPEKKMRVVEPLKSKYDGGYTVKMPVGSTARSREILEKYKELKAKTVFDRLGECKVSSSTHPDSEIIVTFNSASILEQNSTSVFDRLGNKSVKNTFPQKEIVDSEPLPYNGILKKGAPKKIFVKPSSTSITMRADEPKVPVKFRAAPLKPIKPILKKTTGIVNVKSEGIFSKTGLVLNKSSVKNRLGSTSIKSDKVNRMRSC